MTVKELIEILKGLESKKKIMVACDEEWNTIFGNVKVDLNSDRDEYVIFGLSGSELEQ